jgi:hypothetical protein
MDGIYKEDIIIDENIFDLYDTGVNNNDKDGSIFPGVKLLTMKNIIPWFRKFKKKINIKTLKSAYAAFFNIIYPNLSIDIIKSRAGVRISIKTHENENSTVAFRKPCNIQNTKISTYIPNISKNIIKQFPIMNRLYNQDNIDPFPSINYQDVYGKKINDNVFFRMMGKERDNDILLTININTDYIDILHDLLVVSKNVKNITLNINSIIYYGMMIGKGVHKFFNPDVLVLIKQLFPIKKFKILLILDKIDQHIYTYFGYMILSEFLRDKVTKFYRF